MASKAFHCVIDANVALKLFFAQPLSDVADKLFTQLVALPRARFYVPDFFFAECASVIANYVRILKYPVESARQDLTDLQNLAFDVVATSELAAEALEIVMAHQISGYDACYVALSVKVNAPLVTADEKLVQALRGQSFKIQALADFSPSALQ